MRSGVRRSLAGLVVVACVAAVTTACTRSPVSSDATIIVTGRALAASGKPLSNTKVQLYKEADFGEAVVGSVLLLGSLGGICLLPGAPAVCHQGRNATTDASGNYTFTVKGADTQGLIGDAATMDVVFAGGGASTTVQFQVTSTTVALPAVRLWSTQPAVATNAGTISVGYRALPSSYGSGAAYSAQFNDPANGSSLWSQNAKDGRIRIDARILEDRNALAAVTARTSVASGVHAIYGTPGVDVRATAGAPPSRHRPCLAVTGAITPVAVPQSVCAATDGDLAKAGHLIAPKAAVVTGVVVDLGAARPVDLVVARGVSGIVVVELSTDGRTYLQVASASGPTVAAAFTARSARYVRVRSTGLDESLLSEVSVW